MTHARVDTCHDQRFVPQGLARLPYLHRSQLLQLVLDDVDLLLNRRHGCLSLSLHVVCRKVTDNSVAFNAASQRHRRPGDTRHPAQCSQLTHIASYRSLRTSPPQGPPPPRRCPPCSAGTTVRRSRSSSLTCRRPPLSAPPGLTSGRTVRYTTGEATQSVVNGATGAIPSKSLWSLF